jgi:hypothetical protein
MKQMADWLEKRGMSEYAQRFAENGIDVSDRSGPQGHRRIAPPSPKMLRAIGEVAVAAAPLPERVPAAEPKPHDTAERRQVTVMLSATLSAQRRSRRAWTLKICARLFRVIRSATVQRFGGFVAKYMGGGAAGLRSGR